MYEAKEIIMNFNDSFIELLHHCPDKVLCRADKSKFTTAIKLNSALVIEKFIMNVMIYREQIESRDEQFFLTYDYKQLSTDDYVDKLIFVIKETIGELSTEDKNKYWQRN